MRHGRLWKRSDYDDGNRNDPSSSSCAIYLGCIEQEDGVCILPTTNFISIFPTLIAGFSCAPPTLRVLFVELALLENDIQ